MIATRLKTNFITQPMGIDPGEVVLTWIPEQGVAQSAFAVTIAYGGTTVFDSGKIVSSGTEYVPPVAIPSRTQAEWTIVLWDENDVAGEAVSMTFETGMAREDWAARWIDPEAVQPEYCRKAMDDLRLNRASYLRKEFDLAACSVARLYITAHGVYDVWLNGRHVDGYFMAPGTSEYNHRLQVQTYDVTAMLREGRNEMVVTIGEGWWRGSHGWSMLRYCGGTDLALLCQLEADGQVVLCSDGTWRASQNGPLGENDTMRMERYDARVVIDDWHDVREAEFGYQNLVGTCVPVTEHERFAAKLITTPDGRRLLDFGQNFAGYVEFDLEAGGGELLRMTHGEVLDKDGNFQNDNVQNPDSPLCRQVVEYVCKPGRNRYHQTKCYFGFRYVLLETELELDGSEFTGVAVYSDMEQTAHFQCGNREVNQLFSNILWSMKSNFVDVPTDCPHREKLGFTGDCQVFCEAALYLMDCTPVLTRWLREVASAQCTNGCIPYVVPRYRLLGAPYEPAGMDGSAGWSDAFHLVPYRMMRRSNSLGLVQELYPAMRRWVLYNLERARENTRPEHEQLPREIRDYLLDCATNWGEWCEPGWLPADYLRERNETGYGDIATAFLAQACTYVGEMARRLGETEDAAFFREAGEKCREAFRYVYTDDGHIRSDRQCHYVRPIAHGLLDSEGARQAAADLVALIRANGNRIGTGFLTTPYLCHVLTDCGYAEVAYDLLLQTQQPSWLYEVRMGATTTWESWLGIREDTGKRAGSHNHYAFGAVSAWMMGRVLGIEVADGQITLRPCPDRRLGYARGDYLSPVGKIASAWVYEGDEIRYTFEVPCNSEAEICLPDGQNVRVGPGVHQFRTKA